MSSIKKINVNIPTEIQDQINAGDYKINGTAVRDKLGRFVCHLDSLEAGEDQYFSPNIFASIHNYTITSVSVISIQLQSDVKKIRDEHTSMHRDIGRLLTHQANTLIASITNFEEHFKMLTEGSSLTTVQETFSAGAKSASDLAAHIPSYIEHYIGETSIDNRSWNNPEKYSDYLEKSKKYRQPAISYSKFSNFYASEARHFLYSFINVINNINIISLCFDSKIYARYEENLTKVRDITLDLLLKATKGLGDEGDIFEMCYSKQKFGNFRPIKNIGLILKHANIDVHSLIHRNFDHESGKSLDENRLNLIQELLKIINEIDSLLKRNEQFIDLDLKQLPDLKHLKKITFAVE